MYLLIDAGNSRLKHACHDGNQWLMQSASSLDSPSLELPEGFCPDRIVIANVAGEEVATHLTHLLSGLDAPIEWLKASAERCTLKNAYSEPARLGADRWAAAIAAWTLTQRDCVVVCAGTATTIDLIQPDGLFAGGCILPGLEMMLDSLPLKTAGLPRSNGRWQMPPRNTHDAIATGCLLAQTSAIREMSELLSPDAPILLAGGAANQLLPHLGPRVCLHADLVLQGLLCIATNGSKD